MIKKLIYFVLFLSGSTICAQHENTVLLTGHILNADNGSPLAGVHIVAAGKTGTTTDIDGNFLIELSKEDTISISHVGFHEYLVPIPAISEAKLAITIALTPSVTELEEIYIYQWPATLAQFKQKILSTAVEPEEQVVIPGSYQGPPKPVQPGVGSPISFLQSKLSKRIRRRQEFLKKRHELERSMPARNRYNPEYVAEITGIDEEKELEEFMAYCKLTDAFLARVSDYDLIVAINQCYRDFQSEQKN